MKTSALNKFLTYFNLQGSSKKRQNSEDKKKTPQACASNPSKASNSATETQKDEA